MKTNPFLEYILYDVVSGMGPVTFLPMMGGYVLYFEGKVFGMVHGEEFYLKGDKILAAWYESRGGTRFTYTKNNKEAYLYYFSVPASIYEDRDKLSEWIDIALTASEKKK
jgi:DNA transformation protein